MPERRFYEARRQQMMDRQFAGTASMTGMRSWVKKPSGSLRFSLVCTKRCALDLGGGLLMIAGALLSGWRGRKRDDKGLLTLLLLFTCFARAQVVTPGNSPIRNNSNRR